MVALNYLRSARALALAVLVGGLAMDHSYASSNIPVCQRNKTACLRKCPHVGPKLLPGPCSHRCDVDYTICKESIGIHDGNPSSIPQSK